MTTILIALALVLWLLACAVVVALARSAAQGDLDQADDAPAQRLEPRGIERPSSRNPG